MKDKEQQQKPDFEKLAMEYHNQVKYLSDLTPLPYGHYKSACEIIWAEYVEPLQSRIAELEKEYKVLADKYKKLNEPGS